MSEEENEIPRARFVLICILVFIIAFAIGIASKNIKLWKNQFKVNWSSKIGTVKKDFSYGDKSSQKFDIYIPANDTRKSYGLVVYLHAGGFTSGDKSDDKEMLEWICSKGYVAAGINYTLFSESQPDVNIYTQSMEIKTAIPRVIEEAERMGYNIDKMAIGGGSAGGCLALLYAYRDGETAPVPVKMVFEAVGPSSFYREDWESYGFAEDTQEAKEAAAKLFSVMSGKEVKPEILDNKEAYDELMKDVSPLLWINENTPPTLFAYGVHDKLQPYKSSIKLDQKLNEYNIHHDMAIMEHSGHGLQNDDFWLKYYYEYIAEYFRQYM